MFLKKSIFLITLSSSLLAEEKAFMSLNLKEVFTASPIIYSVLSILSFFALMIWLYSFLTLRQKDLIPNKIVEKLKNQLIDGDYLAAEKICKSQDHLLFKMIGSGIQTRAHGANFMIDTMKSEGKRSSASLWQRINLLNDIVMIAPMLGLLGTVIGMFYAFYDINRSPETITSLFDGLGIAVGTTVAGLIVAIIAMIFHTTLKYRLVKTLNLIENEAVYLSHFIQPKTKK